MISTKTSLFKRVADLFLLNEKFSARSKYFVDKNTKYFVSPSDGFLFSSGKIDAHGYIVSKHARRVKLDSIIGRDAFKFSGGYYLNIYLSPTDRHYFIVPYAGIVVSIKKTEGKSFIPIAIGLDRLFSSFEWFISGIKNNASIGVVISSCVQSKSQNKKFYYAMIPVGSLNVNHITTDCIKGQFLTKGKYLGHFSLGSTIILCFDKNFVKSSNLLIKTKMKVKIGTPLFHF